MPRFPRLAPALLALLLAGAADAQTLRGSRASVNRVYEQARKHDLTFYKTGRGVRNAAADGKLVRLRSNPDYRVVDVTYPYALPTTRTFLQRLGAQYRSECGERLVVTSATRPQSLQLWNSVEKTVHPSGMAVDLRKPRSARCGRWLRETLLYVEAAGAIDATEERNPPHFHVAVFPGPYRRYVARAGGDAPAEAEARPSRRTASSSSSSAGGRRGERTASPARESGRRGSSAAAQAREGASEGRRYTVRRGDTLWSIARKNGITVEALKRANGMRAASRIDAGQQITIPAR